MEERIVIDAENAVMGRLASYAAKQALLGRKIFIVNAEKAIVVGRRDNILKTYREKRDRGGNNFHGPFFPTTPEKILKRTIRGMLKYKKGRSAEAFKRVKVYLGEPEEFNKDKKIKSGKGQKGVTLEEISRLLRGGNQ
jgi:large subunit ribosomal protein L13